MLCEITDRYINVFFDDIQLKKENLKSVFLGARVWAPKLVNRSPKWPRHITDIISTLKLHNNKKRQHLHGSNPGYDQSKYEPFRKINPLYLFNIATGKSALQKTEEFLLVVSK